MSLISCKNLTLSYEGFVVLKDLTFNVNQGEYVCIVGENGSGKSTLIKALLRLKTPTSGIVEFGEGLKQNEIGYVAQKTDIQKDFPASVMEVVLSGCLNRKIFKPFYTKQEKLKAENALETLGISALSKKCFRDLSGGQQQRVLLARAMCATKRLFLLDEPVTGLDALATTEFFELVKKMNNELGITIIMVSHDIHCAVKYSDRILHLNNDSIFFGETSNYIKIGKEKHHENKS
ncbi:MAG: ABC transporter ATP-binding protein, partial [Oscillospiraceae bacterium]